MLSLALTIAGATLAPQDSGTLLIDRNRLDRAPIAPNTTPVPPAATIAPTPEGGAPDIVITGIAFDGVEAPAEIGEAVRPFLGQRASTQTLQRIAAAMSDAYGQANIALYTISIPAQDFAGGVVRVRIVEGRIARVEVKDGERHPLARARLDRLTRETPLSRATFERQLTLAREIPGLTLDTELTDPNGDGALLLAATPRQRSRKVGIGFSNRGLDLLGPGQFDARAQFFDLAANGDHLDLTAAASSDFEQLRYGAASYAAPIGADGLSAAANIAYLETRPEAIPVTGTATAAGLTLRYPLIRGFTRSADLSVAFDGLNSDNAVLGNLLSSERTRALRGSASYAASKPKRQFAVAASVSRGVDVLGAREGVGLANLTFTKVTLAANAAHAIGTRAALRINASGQFSDDILPAAERFSVGGEAIGRAFDTALVTGDRGVGGLAELGWRPLSKGSFATSELYVFGDAASLALKERGMLARQDFSIASAGVGARLRFRDKAELGVEGARVLDDPFPGYADAWRLSVGWRLAL